MANNQKSSGRDGNPQLVELINGAQEALIEVLKIAVSSRVPFMVGVSLGKSPTAAVRAKEIANLLRERVDLEIKEDGRVIIWIVS